MLKNTNKKKIEFFKGNNIKYGKYTKVHIINEVNHIHCCSMIYIYI